METRPFIFCLVLFGCASSPSPESRSIPPQTEECGIYTVAGELTDGLVRIDERLEPELLAQLPEEAQDAFLCWYQRPDGQLEARDFDVGYRFSFVDSQWISDEKVEYVLIWHRRVK